jgi:O-antigen/teichoic acid export membrane protein
MQLYGGSNLYFLLGAYGLVLAYVGVMFNLLTTLNLLKSLFYITIFEAIINLVASIILTKLYGYDGVALGTLIASIVVSLICLPILIHKNEALPFSFPFKRFIESFIFYVVMLLILYVNKANEYSIGFKVLIVLAYLISFILFQYMCNKKLFKGYYTLFKAKSA